MRSGQRGSAHTGAIWLLIAAALCVRALIPAGYMTERAGDGSITVALCHSDTVLRIPLKSSRDDKDDAQGRQHPPCAFSSLFGAADLAPPMFALTAPDAHESTFVARIEALRLTGMARLVPPATGPPAVPA